MDESNDYNLRAILGGESPHRNCWSTKIYKMLVLMTVVLVKKLN